MLRRLLERTEPTIRRIYEKIMVPPAPNLQHDRHVEHSWVAANVPKGPGTGLELGCGNSFLSLIAARRGFRMVAIDLLPVHWFYLHEDLTFVRSDIFDFRADSGSLDLIINCSAIEHVGLGRYGDRYMADGDLKAMRLLRTWLRPGGAMIMTIPVGNDSVFAPFHRVYGAQRLPLLLSGLVVEKAEFWTKDEHNRWVQVQAEKALQRNPRQTFYSLGCYVLVKGP